MPSDTSLINMMNGSVHSQTQLAPDIAKNEQRFSVNESVVELDEDL